MTQEPSILDLRGIATPDPVSMAPQTWGWYATFVVALLVLAALSWFAARRRRAGRYRRAALAELATLQDPAQIASLVKRVCLAAFPRTEVAALSGEDWLRFLDATIDGSPFTTGPGRVLAEHYGRETVAVGPLDETVRHWIRRHRAGA